MTLPGQRDYPNINKVSLGSFDQPSEGSKPESASLIYNNCTLTRQEWNTGTWGSQATWGVYEYDDSGEKCSAKGGKREHSCAGGEKGKHQHRAKACAAVYSDKVRTCQGVVAHGLQQRTRKGEPRTCDRPAHNAGQTDKTHYCRVRSLGGKKPPQGVEHGKLCAAAQQAEKDGTKKCRP